MPPLPGEVDRHSGVYDGRRFNPHRSAAWLVRQSIGWPRLTTGLFDLQLDAFHDMAFASKTGGNQPSTASSSSGRQRGLIRPQEFGIAAALSGQRAGPPRTPATDRRHGGTTPRPLRGPRGRAMWATVSDLLDREAGLLHPRNRL